MGIDSSKLSTKHRTKGSFTGWHLSIDSMAKVKPMPQPTKVKAAFKLGTRTILGVPVARV